MAGTAVLGVARTASRGSKSEATSWFQRCGITWKRWAAKLSLVAEFPDQEPVTLAGIATLERAS